MSPRDTWEYGGNIAGTTTESSGDLLNTHICGALQQLSACGIWELCIHHQTNTSNNSNTSNSINKSNNASFVILMRTGLYPDHTKLTDRAREPPNEFAQI